MQGAAESRAGANRSKVTERSKVAYPSLVAGRREVDEPRKAAKQSEAAQRSKAAVIDVLEIVAYIAVITLPCTRAARDNRGDGRHGRSMRGGCRAFEGVMAARALTSEKAAVPGVAPLERCCGGNGRTRSGDVAAGFEAAQRSKAAVIGDHFRSSLWFSNKPHYLSLCCNRCARNCC